MSILFSDAALVAHIPYGSKILVGLSGGVDSVVLLHQLQQFAPRQNWSLSALHVHHGISPHADEWAAFCVALCGEYQIPCHVTRVNIQPLRHLGIEAAARQLRHAALREQPCDFIALAHHADDQIETMFLQLLRGAGVKGASAMGYISQRPNAATMIRPLLHVTRAQIEAYAVQHGLQWVTDESNADTHYPRNFLRHQVLPILGEKFPHYQTTLLRSTQHFAEASLLLDELALQDAQQSIWGNALSVVKLQQLSLPRARNLLRYFLQQNGAPIPQDVQLTDMLKQACEARQDAAMCVHYDGWQVRRYQRKLYVMSILPALEHAVCLSWQGETKLYWAMLGRWLRFDSRFGRGISVEKLQQNEVTLRIRQGGEQLRLHAAAAKRTLKNLFQEQQVPPWERERLPLLFCGEELVAVPKIGIAVAYQAGFNELGVSLDFE